MMASQQPGRRLATVPTNKSNKHTVHPSASAFQSPSASESYAPSNSALYTTTSNEVSDDSGFFSADSPPASPIRPYEDFQLYDSDPGYLDEEASVFPNHGSTYQGSSNIQTSQIPRYSSHTTALNNDDNDVRPSQGSHMVYQSVESDRPSLFGEYQQVYTSTSTTSPLYQWVIQPWRHENRAVHFESLPHYQDEDIRLTPEPTSPSPPSPKHRKSRSGSSKSIRRRKH